MLERKVRYLQIAFNVRMNDVKKLLPQLPRDKRILIEVGTRSLRDMVSPVYVE